MTIEKLYEIYLQYPSVQTDTRKLQKGDLFFALKGDNFNGNQFAKQALETGAAYAVIDDEQFYVDERTIVVTEVLSSLQMLAKHHRSQFNIPFIAITGSNGKTTTKELVHVVLSSSYKTYTTQGNLNNHIGIPLTILKVKQDAEMAVIEMGANHIGEIAGYCKYAMPTHGIITNCGKAHLEGFGSIEGVRKAKGELYDYLRMHNGKAFVMWDYDYLREMSKGIPHVIKYGTVEGDVIGKVKESEPYLVVDIADAGNPTTINTKLVGDYNLPNVLAAVTVGQFFSVNVEKLRSSIEQYTPSNSRSQMVTRGTNKIILDAYNANPSSMKLAIENFARLHAPHKVLVLGAMAELGAESLAEHQTILDIIGQYQWDKVVLVGGDFLKLQHAYLSFVNAAEAKAWFQQQHFDQTHLLVKGSRSTQMEKVIE